jgi:hypothetical protein
MTCGLTFTDRAPLPWSIARRAVFGLGTMRMAVSARSTVVVDGSAEVLRAAADPLSRRKPSCKPGT